VAALRGVWTLAAHDLRRRLRSIVIWGVALGALGALYVALFPTMGGVLEEYMAQMPEEMQQFMDPTSGKLTVEEWLEMEMFNGIIPIALPFFLMIIGARSLAGRGERKTMDLLLSNPVPRWRVVAAALLTMALALAAVLLITWVLTYLAVPFSGVDLPPSRLAAGLLSLWPFCLFFGAFALLLSAFVRRGALAIAVPGVLLVAMYVLDALGQVSSAVEPLRVLSLQNHFAGSLSGDFPGLAFGLTLAGVCVLAAAGTVFFGRRDIYT